jgi:hypothetical protein
MGTFGTSERVHGNGSGDEIEMARPIEAPCIARKAWRSNDQLPVMEPVVRLDVRCTNFRDKQWMNHDKLFD